MLWPSKGSILIGTKGGAIYDLELSQNAEKSCIQVYSGNEAITGLAYHFLDSCLLVVMTTSMGIYQFMGTLSSSSSSHLLILQNDSTNSRPKRYWIHWKSFIESACFLYGNDGVGYWEIHSISIKGSSFEHASIGLADGCRDLYCVHKKGCYRFMFGWSCCSSLSLSRTRGDPSIISYVFMRFFLYLVAVTKYHFIFLTSQSLVIVNKLDFQNVMTVDIPLSSQEQVVDLVQDLKNETVWVATTNNLYELLIHDEDRWVWKVYFEKKAYRQSYQFCKT